MFNARNSASATVVRNLTAVAAAATIVATAFAAPIFAIEISVADQIALAKSQIWGEYPKAEQAYREVNRPVVSDVAVVEETPTKVETKAQVAAPVAAPVVAQTASKAPVVAQTVSKAPVVAQTVSKAPATEAAPAPKSEQAPATQATVEAAEVVPVEAAPVETVAPVASTGDTWIDEIVRLTNVAREAEGLGALSINATLNQAAAIRTAELPASPSPHYRPNGDAFYTIFPEVGLTVKVGGENYAIATPNAYTPEQIVNAWLASPGHRKNIMNGKYTQIGIGHGTIGDKEYFEQLFTA